MQAMDAELKQQLQAAGALETDLRAQLNVSLLLLVAPDFVARNCQSTTNEVL